ncbi:hypothetical protein [Bdellovibrio sp. NC01]|uniref:hypothetical protein n=1 Tax=Bdellovibrio sp. NC01 TaxID=2220073 RepID=UPI0011578A22|nr:hypothetical protein [Bdellovibrio sp. NC01]
MNKMFLLGALFCCGCATYNYASNVKMISFDDNVQKGQSVGQVRGEDCTWNVLGYQLGGLPTIDRAFTNARFGAGGLEAAGFQQTKRVDGLRYVNNVTTKNEGFNAGVVAKNCIVVTGMGYK